MKIDEVTAKEIAINFLTHGKTNPISCTAILKGKTWHVGVTLEKPTKVTRVVVIDAETGRILPSTNSRDLGGSGGSKFSTLAFGLYYIVNILFNDTPVQTATCITNVISQCN